MPPILEVKNLSKSYSLRRAASSLREAFQLMRPGHFHVEQKRPQAFWALRDISFEVSKGESVGFIGRNGAGKSTLLKILSRVTQPSAGEANIYGRTGSLLGIGAGFHPDFTGRENVFLNGVMLGMSHGEIRRNFEKIAAFAELERFLDTPIKYYSSGMYVRLAFAVAAHFEPEVLLIDEVLGVGDASFQKKCYAKLEEIRRRGSTVLIVSHDLLSVQRFCDRAILLEGGSVLDMGRPDAVVAKYLDVIQRDQ